MNTIKENNLRSSSSGSNKNKDVVMMSPKSSPN